MKYNVAIEVSEAKYGYMMNECSGLIAGRQENGKFYIKLWIEKAKLLVIYHLNS